MSSKLPRLEFEELTPDLQDRLRPRVERLNYLGEFFKVMGNVPTVLGPFIDFTENLKDVLPKNLTEVGALTCATLMNNAYERNQHEQLAIKLGYTKEWIIDVCRVMPDEAILMTEEERIVQRMAMALLEYDWDCSREVLDELIEHIGQQQALGTMMLIGRYTVHAMMVNTLNLEPPVKSVL